MNLAFFQDLNLILKILYVHYKLMLKHAMRCLTNKQTNLFKCPWSYFLKLIWLNLLYYFPNY